MSGDCCLGERYYHDADGDGWGSQTDYHDVCIPPGAGWLTQTESLGYNLRGDGINVWDQDDSDPIITYEDCSTQPLGSRTFIVQKNTYTGDYIGANANDWSFDNVIKPGATQPNISIYQGACVGSANFCVINSDSYNINGIAVARGSSFDGSAYGYDENMYCSTICDAHGCEWLDYDSNQATCELRYTWSKQGSDNLSLGEYDGILESECCGDDSAEEIVVEHCRGSSTKGTVPSLCCPNDGQTWYIQDNECVTECPDVMDTPPTWIPLAVGDDLYSGYDAKLTDPQYGYCCDGTLDASKPLCQVGETGCYTQLGIPRLSAPSEFGTKYFCDGADECLVESCLDGNTYDACEIFNSCDDTKKSVSYSNADQKEICSIYTVTDIPVDNSNYYILKSGCDATDTLNCQAVTRTVYTGSSCQALCQIDDQGNKINCQEVCSSYSRQDMTTYHGGECQILNDCVDIVESQTTDYIDPATVGSCSTFGTCNQFGCAVSECGPYGCPVSPQYFELSTVCSEDQYCSTLSCNTGVPNYAINDTNLFCINATVANGNPLIINVSGNNNLKNTYFQCNAVTGTQGDPLCEYLKGNIAFDSINNRCSSATEQVCDFSAVVGGVPQNYLENGCDAFSTNGNDYWGDYNNNCVGTVSPYVSTYSGLYDQACCYAYTIDGFDIYDDDLDSNNVQNGIRVY